MSPLLVAASTATGSAGAVDDDERHRDCDRDEDNECKSSSKEARNRHSERYTLSDRDAAPSPAAIASVRGESSGSSRLISRLETTACTTPESAKPRISAHRISQNIPKANESARTTL